MDKIRLKRSFTAGAVPSASDLDVNECAINWVDAKLFVKTSAGVILTLNLGGGSGGGSGADTLLRSLFAPGPPTGVTATAGNTQATVSWTAPTGVLSQAPVTDYVIQFSSDSGSSWSTFSDGTSTSTSAVVTSLANSVAYTFRVAAVSSLGQSNWSSASSAVTPISGTVVETTSGLFAWYDISADNSVYSAQSGGSVVSSSGGLVYRIADKSGNGHDLKTYYDGPYVPSLVTSDKNGKNSLSFNYYDGGNTFVTSNALQNNTFSINNPLTIFAVWKPLDNTALFNVLRNNSGDMIAPMTTILGVNGDSVYVLHPGDNRCQWTGSATGRIGNWLCASFVLNGTSSSVRVNGSLDTPGGTNSTPGGSNPSSYNLSNGCNGFTLTGVYHLGELIFYSGALSSGTVSSIENSLMTKWGIS
jgi:hypothetical protein